MVRSALETRTSRPPASTVVSEPAMSGSSTAPAFGGRTSVPPMRRRRKKISRLRVYSDPFQHALIAAAVVAPLVSRAGPGMLRTAVGAGLVIDVDHAIAARSFRTRALIGLPA